MVTFGEIAAVVVITCGFLVFVAVMTVGAGLNEFAYRLERDTYQPESGDPELPLSRRRPRNRGGNARNRRLARRAEARAQKLGQA